MPPVWKGTLTFGLVSVPVELRRAVQRNDLRFHLLHAADDAPVNFERVCSADGKTVPWSETARGYEYEKGKFVVLSEEDFKSAALAASPAIEIVSFVDAAHVDARWFETPYYIVPGKGGDHPYAVLREAIRKSNTIGLGTIVLRERGHVAGVTVVGDALVLELMRFADELVPAKDYTLPPASGLNAKEIALAEQLIGALTGEFDPEQFRDEYRANLLRIIHAKMKGRTVTLPARAAPAGEAKVVDLMERLRASLAQSGTRGSRTRHATSGRGTAQRAVHQRSARRG